MKFFTEDLAKKCCFFATFRQLNQECIKSNYMLPKVTPYSIFDKYEKITFDKKKFPQFSKR